MKLILTLLCISLLSACTTYDTYSQSTGFAAPHEYSIKKPLNFCTFSVDLSDPLYIEADKDLVLPVLKNQVIRYINADGRLHIQDDHCTAANNVNNNTNSSLAIDFVLLTDRMVNDSMTYSAKSQVVVMYEDHSFSFLTEEVSNNAEPIWCSYRCSGEANANSARNRSRLMDTLISTIVNRIEGGGE